MTRGAWAWTGLTLLAVVIAFLASFVVATLPGRFGWEAPVRLDLAIWLVLFGVIGVGGTLGAARIAFGASPEVRLLDGVLAVLGFVIAAFEEMALHEWAEGSIGNYDADFIGPTAGLSLCIVLVAVALFAVRVAPEGASGPPRLAVALGAVIVAAIVLSNAPALADGIGRGGLVAAGIGLAGAYAIGALAIALTYRRPRVSG